MRLEPSRVGSLVDIFIKAYCLEGVLYVLTAHVTRDERIKMMMHWQRGGGESERAGERERERNFAVLRTRRNARTSWCDVNREGWNGELGSIRVRGIGTIMLSMGRGGGTEGVSGGQRTRA